MAPVPTRLAHVIKKRRHELGLSTYAVSAAAGLVRSTYVRIETGEVTDPRPEKLQAIADALDLSAADLFAAAGWLPRRDLPHLKPYLRTRYSLTDEAVADIEATFQQIGEKYGIDFDRDAGFPRAGEDE